MFRKKRDDAIRDFIYMDHPKPNGRLCIGVDTGGAWGGLDLIVVCGLSRTGDTQDVQVAE